MKDRVKIPVWVIMSKDKQSIVKGNPRSRVLVRLDDKEDNKRVMLYSRVKYAEGAMLVDGILGEKGMVKSKDLCVVEASISLTL